MTMFSKTSFSQNEIIGTWEYKSGELKGHFLPSNYSFWMKFSKEDVIISNSNTKFSQTWFCDIGKWHQAGDTIFINIFENESVQPYSSMMSHRKSNKAKDIRFIINRISDSELELLPLDSFIGSKIERSKSVKISMPFLEIGIEEYECFAMKKTTEGFQWSNKF